ncbi:MAG: thiamine pyrophosphate-binding protein [Chloroflexi bacterium]|nr:thiamine pyrophosphate-binding protein [Chloroflexota bacterium]
MKRWDCLQAIAGEVGDALTLSAAACYLEWRVLRPSDGNFRIRTLGLGSSIALGLALCLPNRKIVVLDGDGALLMNLCALPTIARQSPRNLVHIVFDNERYEGSGGIPTATAAGTDIAAVARGAGFKHACTVRTVEDFKKEALAALERNELSIIVAKVEPGNAAVPPAEMDEVECKYRFVRHIERTENVKVIRTHLPTTYTKKRD